VSHRREVLFWAEIGVVLAPRLPAGRVERVGPVSIEGVARRSWKWSLRRLACRTGLHFLDWDDLRDGWVCSCRRQFLWIEQLSNRDDRRFYR